MPEANEKPVAISFYAPPDLRDLLRDKGSENHRSMSQEIIHRLTESLKAEDKTKKG